MFGSLALGERAVLVHVASHEEPENLTELRELAVSAGAQPVAVVRGRRHAPDPRYYIGKGKLEELRGAIREYQAELVLFDHPLTPSQERNLESELGVRAVDRTRLILDIFAQRARSFEGKLQVELAQLRHLSTRLVRGWTHLERQKGGIGLRGPGETQLETDKRLITRRIAQIQKRLEKVEAQRKQGRIARKRAELPVVGLVGYTNAGKSTLFNTLTGADTYSADQLFATLDPTLRRLCLSPALTVILADTVGFIRDLPHDLVAAFRSTLREATEADLLLHVIDASDGRCMETVAEVEQVLHDIGGDQVPRIQVFNKLDRLEYSEPRLERDQRGIISRIWVSAKTGQGIPMLTAVLSEYFGANMLRRSIHLASSEADLRARLYRIARILKEEEDGNGGWNMEIEVPERQAADFRSLESIAVP